MEDSVGVIAPTSATDEVIALEVTTEPYDELSAASTDEAALWSESAESPEAKLVTELACDELTVVVYSTSRARRDAAAEDTEQPEANVPVVVS